MLVIILEINVVYSELTEVYESVCSVSKFVSETNPGALLEGSSVEEKRLLLLSSNRVVVRASGTPEEYFCVSYVDGVIVGVGCKFVKLGNDADGIVWPKSVDNDGMSDVDTKLEENWSVVDIGMALDVCSGMGRGVTTKGKIQSLIFSLVFLSSIRWEGVLDILPSMFMIIQRTVVSRRNDQ